MSRNYSDVVARTPQLLLRTDLCRSAGDPKFSTALTPVYIPLSDFERVRAQLSNPDQAKPLTDPQKFFSADAEHGLLYLPHPYLVPGGRFNEMYGWDTAFAVFAWAKEHPQLMRDQVENQLYQIRAYGKVLNANRTYYLSRSQPPLVAAMTLAVSQDRDWLAKAYPILCDHHAYWTSGDRLAGNTGLSRYWDDSDLPAPEVIASEAGYFDHAKEHLRGDADFYDAAKDALTPLYHRANRTMRASGFDPTGHWGYGALRCLFHAPVCLNALLYKMEDDLATIADILSLGVKTWRDKRDTRKKIMQALMFDAETGLYHDFDFIKREQNKKTFATAFHPFWAGIYDDDQDLAAHAAQSALQQLETPHGIVMSREESGSQWDYPYGWPPIQYFAFEGLKRCGQHDTAKRIAGNFSVMAERVYAAHHALFEKYNVVDGTLDIKVTHGYNENVSESGTFLWTAAVLKLADIN